MLERSGVCPGFSWEVSAMRSLTSPVASPSLSVRRSTKCMRPGGRVRRDRPQRQRLVPLPRVLRVGPARARRYGRRPFVEEEQDRIAGSGRGSGKVLVWSGSTVSGPTLPNGSQEVEGSFPPRDVACDAAGNRQVRSERQPHLAALGRLEVAYAEVQRQFPGVVRARWRRLCLAGTLEHDVARVGAERGRRCQGGDGQGEERGRGDGFQGLHPGAGGTCGVWTADRGMVCTDPPTLTRSRVACRLALDPSRSCLSALARQRCSRDRRLRSDAGCFSAPCSGFRQMPGKPSEASPEGRGRQRRQPIRHARGRRRARPEVRRGMGRALLVALGASIAGMGPAFAGDPPYAVHGEALVAALLEFVEDGSPGAQFLLGSLYDTGQQGVPEDDVEAVKWYRLAAEQGLAEARVNLGVMYDNGEGVPEDDAEAARWYRLAAEQGHSQARLNVGIQYITGEGVAADPVQAYAWLDVAAAVGATLMRRAFGIVWRKR